MTSQVLSKGRVADWTATKELKAVPFLTQRIQRKREKKGTMMIERRKIESEDFCQGGVGAIRHIK
jgi:hypothetical protein